MPKNIPLIAPILIDMPAYTDERGSFVKTFNHAHFLQLGIPFELQESYYSLSAKDVIRGMHFQLPPHQHSKIVFCPVGAILDVAIDLRKSSPHYGRCYAQLLSAANHKAFYIPEGFAHGFKSLQDHTLTYYLVSSGYHASADTGIAYNSIGFDWDCAQPIMSARDEAFVAFKDFESPF